MADTIFFEYSYQKCGSQPGEAAQTLTTFGTPRHSCPIHGTPPGVTNKYGVNMKSEGEKLMMTTGIPTTPYGKYHFGGGGAVGSGTVQVTKSQLAKIPCLVPTKNWFGLHSLLLIVIEQTGKQLIVTIKLASFSLCCRRQGRWLSGMLGLLCVFICMHARVILLGFLQMISNSLLHKVPGFGDRQL